MCKKTIFLFLASALALGLLAGCGNDTDSAAASSAAPAASVTDSAPAAPEATPAAVQEESTPEASAQEQETVLNEAPEPEDYTLSEDGETPAACHYPSRGIPAGGSQRLSGQGG